MTKEEAHEALDFVRKEIEAGRKPSEEQWMRVLDIAELLAGYAPSATSAILAVWEDYNTRRYSTPWVGCVLPNGKIDFTHEVGFFASESGKLVVLNPIKEQVYAYGQKDYYRNDTVRFFAKWDGVKFIPCDRAGYEVTEGE